MVRSNPVGSVLNWLRSTSIDSTSMDAASRIGRASIVEPLEDRLLMALAKAAGKSGTSVNLSTNSTVRQQQLLADPDEPLSGSLSVTYDPYLVTLIDAVSGPGYTIDYDNSFVQVLPFVGAPHTTEFNDGEFDTDNWDTLITKKNTTSTSATVTQHQNGGVGDNGYGGAFPYLQVDTGESPKSGSTGLVIVFERNNNAVYDPSYGGEINSIDYSENSIAFGDAYGGGYGSQMAGMALEQNGVIYYGPNFVTGESASSGFSVSSFNQWNTNDQTGLTADNFVNFNTFAAAGGNGGFEEGSHPDFSAGAAPITFGFYRVSTGDVPVADSGGIDNWNVTVHQDNFPPVPVLESFTQYFGDDEENPALDAAETGYAQVSFFTTPTDGDPEYGNITPYSGVVGEDPGLWTNLGHVGVTGVDTFGLIFGFTGNVPPNTNPDAHYQVVATVSDDHADFLQRQDGSIVETDDIDPSGDISSNIAPEITSTGGPYTMSEGGDLLLSGAATDDDGDPGDLAYEWYLDGDNTPDAFGANPLVTASELQALGLGDGTSLTGNLTIKLKVTDEFGNGKSDTANTTLTINNVAPTATANSANSVNEGSPLAVSLTSPIDPSEDDTNAGFHYSFATSLLGLAGSYATAGTTSSANITFDDNVGVHTVFARIFDKDGGSTTYSKTITVNNVAPTATLSNNGPKDEGSLVNIAFTGGLDPSTADTSAGLHYSFATSMAGLAASYAAAGTLASTSLSFNDNGPKTVYGRVFDKDGGSTDYSTIVTVNNVAPTATLSKNGGPTYTEGGNVLLSFSGQFDPSSADTSAGLHYSFASSMVGLSSTYGGAGTATSANVTIPDSGAVTLYGRIFDKDNGYTTYMTTLTSVINVAPTATFTNNGPVNEGSPVELKFAFQADVQSDLNAGLRYSFNLVQANLATTYGTAESGTPTKQMTFDDNGSYTVYGRVFDKDGGSTTYSTIVVVNNVKPTAAISNVNPVPGGATTLTVSATDPSGADRSAGFKYLINWGDGSAVQTVNPTANNGNGVGLSHNFAGNGPYTVSVTATDKNGAVSDPVTTQINLVFVGARLQSDPSSPNQQALFIYGGPNNDFIRLQQSGNTFKVLIGNTSYGPFSGFTRVIAYGNGGNDNIVIDQVRAVLFGGEGNDILIAGSGASIVDGGAGLDAVTGLNGKDLVIGGLGADFLYGGSSEDILVSGRTAFDAGTNADIIALTAISNEWNSASNYATRISHITGASGGGLNGSAFFKASAGAGQSVFDDAAFDVVAGGTGQDWFLTRNSGGGVIDAWDRIASETATNLL